MTVVARCSLKEAEIGVCDPGRGEREEVIEHSYRLETVDRTGKKED